MIPSFEDAVRRISEVVMFENWLRFYFIAEEGDKLYLRLGEPAMEQIRKRYPAFHGLAERLNNEEIDHQTSLSAVCLFVATEINGVALPEELIGRVFDSARFHAELQLFGAWVQAHEERLDASFQEFNAWLRMYEEWKKTDEVRDYAKKLTDSLNRTVQSSTETSQ